MTKSASGSVLVFLFVISTSIRDVWFGGIFQSYDIYMVTLVAFSLASLCFVGVAVGRGLDQLRALAVRWRDVVLVNVGTAVAWLTYFHALKVLEPAIANTLHAGAGPITISALGAVGLHVAQPTRAHRGERLLHAGILVALLLLGAVVLTGYSTSPGQEAGVILLGLLAALGSGAIIAVTLLVSKRMNEAGVAPESILAVRFIAVIAFAGIAVQRRGGFALAPEEVVSVGGAALLLIVAPIYLMQLGLARTAPLTVEVISALGPSLVLTAQIVEGRIGLSPYTLSCVVLYSGLVLLSNFARGWYVRS